MNEKIVYVFKNNHDWMGAPCDCPKEMMRCMYGWAFHGRHHKQHIFSAQPEEMDVGLFDIRNWDEATDKFSMDFGKLAPECKTLEDCVSYVELATDITLEEFREVEEEIYAKNPEEPRVKFYFNGEVVTGAEMVYKLIHEIGPLQGSYVMRPISRASVEGAEPRFWNPEDAVATFEKNPAAFPGYEKLIVDPKKI